MTTPSPEQLRLIAKLDDLLPQTQCRQCGTEGCEAYARAMVLEGLPINRCAPGGAKGIEQLAQCLGVPPLPLDPEFGTELPFAVARIRAAQCIGCSWCIKVCPPDAIAGAPKHLHGILEARCTGCSLCLAACPVDCIDMVEVEKEWTTDDAHRAREHFRERNVRQARQRQADRERLEALSAKNSKAKSARLSSILAKAKAKK